jgi:acetamidase/formamidase
MESKSGRSTAKPQYFLTADQTHNKFSSVIPPAIKVPSGSVIEVYTKEASDEQITANSAVEDVVNMKSDPIHPLTGPVYVEGAEPGDILAVKIHKIELGEYGWQAIVPGFGFLADEFSEAKLKIFKLGANKKSVNFTDKISIQLKPFAGVMGVAPKTEEMLVTGPPRANGGNMDDPSLVEGTTVYFPVFVKGALFSVGDAHAVQGYGEVCGTAIEAPVRIVYEVNVIKGRKIAEPQYETDDYYAVTGFGRTIDEAAKKATGYMIDYLAAEHGLSREDAYMLCSLAGDLKIAEVVDIPHMLVTMHISKDVLGM